VDGRSPEEAAAAVEAAWRQLPSKLFADGGALDRLDPLRGVAAQVHVPEAGRTYPIIVRDHSLSELGAICRERGLRGRAFILTDDVLMTLQAVAAVESLRSCAFEPQCMAIPSGEHHKNLDTLSRIYDWLLEHRVERSDFLVCVGGGVVTDIGGFAAATILRGIDFVHVPTTLLGMVDAAVGGKTGIDHARGKNMIGAFAQPRAVVVDPLVLSTLPDRQLRNGWAELVKHGLIFDGVLFAELQRSAGATPPVPTAAQIARSVAIKAEVVSADEREAGLRALLNYGHTIGHAIEAVTGYTRYLHGEAVAIGMHAAGIISVEMRLLSPADLDRQQALLRACGLPERAPGLDVDAVLAATMSDKKVRSGAVQWVLLDAIGHAVARNDVPLAS
jgi:3-dehydroquinate synthase